MTSDLSAFRGAAGVQRAQAAVKELGERAIPTNPSNYEIWITHQIGANPDLSRAIETLIAQGKSFSDEQMAWLKAIKDYLAANVEIAPADLMRDQPFSDWGGVVAARRVFGTELNGMLEELSEGLVA